MLLAFIGSGKNANCQCQQQGTCVNYAWKLLIKLHFKSFVKMCKKKKSQSIFVSAFCNVAQTIKREQKLLLLLLLLKFQIR